MVSGILRVESRKWCKEQLFPIVSTVEAYNTPLKALVLLLYGVEKTGVIDCGDVYLAAPLPITESCT